MCGIAGILSNSKTAPSGSLLSAMIATLGHRGPDHQDVFRESEVGLAHARLSIIDLAGGNQPMLSWDRRFCIVFNGEIFNYLELRDDLVRAGHVFRTRSDTEVILEMYRSRGEQCVQYFNGQWSFALWDREERKLFASRDRMGVRPFFYTQVADEFIFASEVKAIFSHQGVTREINFEALDQIFTFWTALQPSTIFKGIYQLPPGHSLSVRNGYLSVHRYWQIDYDPAPNSDDSVVLDKVEELKWLLEDAVRIRLRADVPVGTYLSGGLDSTLTTALARQLHTGKLKSFSVAFDDAEYDERRFQSEASTFLSTEHQTIQCGDSAIQGAFEQVVWHAETAFLRTAPAPLFLLSRAVRENGFKVVITGEGADEVFGGYDIFKEAKIRRFLLREPDSVYRPLLLKRLYPYINNIQHLSKSYLERFFAASTEDLKNPFFSHLPRWRLTERSKAFFSSDLRSILEQHGSDPNSTMLGQLPAAYPSWPPFCQGQYLETAYLLPEYILSTQGDRVAMAHSVESRFPFLDHRVVAFAAKLSPDLKMKVLNEKYLLKRVAKGLIPESIRHRSKQPYRAPDGKTFFSEGNREYVRDTLSGTKIREAGIFDETAVRLLLDKFESRKAIGVKDDMALIGILTTQILIHQFLARGGNAIWNKLYKLEKNYAVSS